MIRFFVSAVVLAALVWFATSVPLGSRTLWGHLSAIWATPEAKGMREGIKEATGPAVEKVKRGTEAGIKAAVDDAGEGDRAGGDRRESGRADSQDSRSAPQLLRRATQAARDQQWGTAAALAESAFVMDPALAEAAMLAVTANCAAGNKVGAERMATELGATAHQAASAACKRQGVLLDVRP